jgi:hypothetical protein
MQQIDKQIVILIKRYMYDNFKIYSMSRYVNNNVHLFFTNILVQMHNKIVFIKTLSPTFNFEAKDIHHYSFKFLDDLNKIVNLHSIVCIKQEMLVELCVGNHTTSK